MMCPVCLAADNADPTNLRALVRYQSIQLDRARAELLEARTWAAERANRRVAEQQHRRKQAT